MDNLQLSRALTQNGDFVRALAHRLVRDPERADDVVQETWLRFLERTPRATGSLRHWFRTVARNLASSTGQAEQERRERDERAARPEGLPSAADEYEKAELLHRVVEGVLALEEPYRSTLLARYYRGWSAARLASETGTPLATVRSREQRALERLRERLDRDAGGRKTWALALGEILAFEPSPPAIPWRAAGLATGVAAATVVLAGLAWYAARGPAARELSTAPAVVQQPAPEPVQAAALVPARQPNAVAAASVQAGPVAPAAPPLSEIRARFVFSDGTPAAGVAAALELGGAIQRNGTDPREQEPSAWKDQSVTSGSDGRVAFQFAKPHDRSLELTATLPDHASISWSWFDVEPGAVLDLGDTAILRAGVVTGRLVRGDGTPILGQDWRVDGTSVGFATPAGRQEARARGVVDVATGVFRLEGLPPGTVALGVMNSSAGQVKGPRVTLEEGGTATADIVYSGPDVTRRILVDVEMQRFRTVTSPGAENVRLLAKGEPVRSAQPGQGPSRFVFDDVAPGSYTLEIDDPRCEPWRQQVRTGTRVQAKLEGNSAVVLDVTDANGKSVVHYEAQVTLRNVNTFPNSFPLDEKALAGGRIRGMFAGDSTIEVRAGDALGSADVDGLAIGEKRAVAIRVAPLAPVSGIARFADGRPAAGLTAALLRPALTGDSNASPTLRFGFHSGNDDGMRVELAVAEVDAAGRFELVAPRAGDYLVRVGSGDGTEAFSAGFHLGSEPRKLEFVLARPGSLAGRVHVPAGASPDGLRVRAFPLEINAFGDGFESAVGELDSQGRFSIPSLAAGRARLFLMLPPLVRHQRGGWMGTSSGSNGTRPVFARELGTVDVPAGGRVEREFTLDDYPGTIELAVRVNGAPAPRLGLHLKSSAEGPCAEIQAETDDQGVFGPAPLFAGTWTVEVEDADTGWHMSVPEPLVIRTAAPTVSALELQRP
jgi:RNA polymerase sigma-70 factor (ECF subfamily)